jgi:hypothetical protein
MRESLKPYPMERSACIRTRRNPDKSSARTRQTEQQLVNDMRAYGLTCWLTIGVFSISHWRNDLISSLGPLHLSRYLSKHPRCSGSIAYRSSKHLCLFLRHDSGRTNNECSVYRHDSTDHQHSLHSLSSTRQSTGISAYKN